MSKSANLTMVAPGRRSNNNGFDTPRHCSLPWKNKKIGVFWGYISFTPTFGQFWSKKWEFVALLVFFPR